MTTKPSERIEHNVQMLERDARYGTALVRDAVMRITGPDADALTYRWALDTVNNALVPIENVIRRAPSMGGTRIQARLNDALLEARKARKHAGMLLDAFDLRATAMAMREAVGMGEAA